MIRRKDDSLIHLVMFALGAEDFVVRIELDDETLESTKYCTFSMSGVVRHMLVEEYRANDNDEEFNFTRKSISGDDLVMFLNDNDITIFNSKALRSVVRSSKEHLTRHNEEEFSFPLSFVSGLLTTYKYEKGKQ